LPSFIIDTPAKFVLAPFDDRAVVSATPWQLQELAALAPQFLEIIRKTGR